MQSTFTDALHAVVRGRYMGLGLPVRLFELRSITARRQRHTQELTSATPPHPPPPRSSGKEIRPNATPGCSTTAPASRTVQVKHPSRACLAQLLAVASGRLASYLTRSAIITTQNHSRQRLHRYQLYALLPLHHTRPVFRRRVMQTHPGSGYEPTLLTRRAALSLRFTHRPEPTAVAAPPPQAHPQRCRSTPLTRKRPLDTPRWRARSRRRRGRAPHAAAVPHVTKAPRGVPTLGRTDSMQTTTTASSSPAFHTHLLST